MIDKYPEDIAEEEGEIVAISEAIIRGVQTRWSLWPISVEESRNNAKAQFEKIKANLKDYCTCKCKSVTVKLLVYKDKKRTLILDEENSDQARIECPQQ